MLTDSFLDFIRKEKLFTKEDKLLLAISGGVDSVVLAHLLSINGFQFSLAHMNFQLRGEDSEKDQQLVEELAEKYNVSCYIEKVKILKAETKVGESTQMQARSLRYQWFNKLMLANGYHFLLTAHHAEDSLETVLLNLTRGTGIRGMRGIVPMHDKIGRPLLFADKSSIRKYAVEQNLIWREDISNQSDNYRRNEIRHHVMPKLLAQNPNLFSVFNNTSLKLRAAEEAFEEKVMQIKSEFTREVNSRLLINKTLLDGKFAQVYLAEIVKPYGFTLQQLEAFSFTHTGARLENEIFCLVADREELIVFLRDDNNRTDKTYSISDNEGIISGIIAGNRFSLMWEPCNKEEVDFSQNRNVAFLNADNLEMPLLVRPWSGGDKFQPLGMKGKKKISDFLIDEKVALPDKAKQLVIESGNEIIWLVNHRISEKYKISTKVEKVIKIEFYEAE